MIGFSVFPRLFLVLALMLTSVPMVLARGQTGPTESLTICSDAGDAVITVDANGNPVAPSHFCPDCLAAVAVFLLPAAFSLPVPLVTAEAAPLPPPRRLHAHHSTPQCARGPPCRSDVAFTPKSTDRKIP
ncbi:hypothetical protein [Rhodobacter ferrooxidans]|uniref:DUF2946 domain-containing protein n=1 Tax=Rhodobacter ferrooxidans TaxID=371731 RepID=C8RZT3_9RHOB|nr:hypothetical protein [Rhodobacter sp. SW2]EEW25880.1 hypothetical protein Rsw2DRAFT_1311 [Rhodobacter sp. SW2]